MKPFGEFLMRNRWNAALLALVFAAVPFLNWLAMIIMSLVTLRKGAKEGIFVLVFALVPSIVYGIFGDWTVAYYAIPAAFALWVLASVLHATHNWTWVLLAGVLITLFILAGMHLYMDDVNAWWQQKMMAYMQQAGKEVALSTEQQAVLMERMAVIGLGLQAALLLLVDLVWLCFARYWQALIYNPGKLQSELYSVRMPIWASIMMVLLCAVAWGLRVGIIVDIMPSLLLCFALAGLSVMHYMIKARQRSWIWFLLMYLAMFFLLPYMLVALLVVAVSDSVFNLRRRVTPQ